jgi:hypothetical protein
MLHADWPAGRGRSFRRIVELHHSLPPAGERTAKEFVDLLISLESRRRTRLMGEGRAMSSCMAMPDGEGTLLP